MMKQIFFRLTFILMLAAMISSCSLIKNETASSNFKRVKYNAHLKLTKSKTETTGVAAKDEALPKTVESFSKEEVVPGEEELYASNQTSSDEPTELQKTDVKTKKALNVQAAAVVKTLKKIEQIEIPQNKKRTKISSARKDYWWEDDIEGWPWLEIVFAVIAILVIAILVSILLSVLGGLISSLFGLILLILLAYILYTLWV